VVSFSQVSPPKSSLHLSPPLYSLHLIVLDFITHTILGEECRLLSSSVRSFLHSPVTSSLHKRCTVRALHYSNTAGLHLSYFVEPI
jgi:hypothetical protein